MKRGRGTAEPTKADLGFVTLEAIVAFSIVSAILSVVFLGISQALQAGAHAASIRHALRVARDGLESVGLETQDLSDGEASGVDADGYTWRVVISDTTVVGPQRGSWVEYDVWAPMKPANRAPLVVLRTYRIGRSSYP